MVSSRSWRNPERAERDGEADHDDECLDEDERRGEREAARVARPVGCAKSHDGVLHECDATGRGERLAGVVARQLPRLADMRSGAHDASTSFSCGTITVSASGLP